MMGKKLVQRVEAAVDRLEALSLRFSTSNGSSDLPRSPPDGVTLSSDPAITAYDGFLHNFLGRLLSAAEKIGGQVLEVTRVVQDAFSVQKDLLFKIKQAQKPKLAGLQEFLQPLNEVILRANAMTEGRRTESFNHVKAAADCLTALAWIAYLGKECGMSLPAAHIEESWQMAEFYNNKILVEYRNKNPDHIEWAKALKEVYLPGLRDFVKSFYSLGPVWKAVGGSNAPPPPPPPTCCIKNSYFCTTSSSPPPPMSSPLVSTDALSARPKQGMSAVFQEIRSGKSVTSGLRKVTDDMKTKNRTDRTSVVGTTGKEPQTSTFSFLKVGPPKLELQMGRKWAVENQIGKKELIIDDCDSKQSVYVFGCKDSILQVKGKVNNITINKCTKMGAVFMDVVAACEIVNCNGVEVQCQGSAPTISVDNTSGCHVYLSKGSLGTSITTAKSSEIKVLVAGEQSDGDWVEHALPQQFVHIFKDGEFVTSPVSHSGV